MAEKTQYYAKDHHKAIIDRESFEAANAIIDLNASEKGNRDKPEKYSKRYVYSGKIVCGQCGGKCKRAKLYRYPGFVCNTHVKDKNACSVTAVPEALVIGAFVTMMNKLVYAREKILIPYSVTLRQGQTKANVKRFDSIDLLLEQNLERRQQILQFFSKGLLDPAVYQEESDALAKEEEKLLEEKKTLTVDAGKKRRDNLAELLIYTGKGQMITEFDDDLFTRFVDHIVLYSKTEVGFAMKCAPFSEKGLK